MHRHGIVVAAAVTLLCLPGTAAAATLTRPDNGARLAYQSAPGETSDLHVADAFSPELGAGLSVLESGAPLTVPEGCSTEPAIQCPYAPVEVRLGDRADRARVVSHVDGVTVWGEDGDDAILASGTHGTAFGGRGADRVEVSSNDLATARGGDGGDQVIAAGGMIAEGYGDDGDDLVVNGAATRVTLDGGEGRDSVVGRAALLRAATASGGPGADVLVVDPRADAWPRTVGWTLLGGAGADVIVAGPFDDAVDAGAGFDRVGVRGGGSDTVSCGRGVDLVFADASDVIAGDCELRVEVASGAFPEAAGALAAAAALEG